MPYLRPPLLMRRVFNPIVMRLGISGTQALSVRRRRSGGVQRVPVLPVVVDGAPHLVSARGETDWVRNLRAAGTCRLGPHGDEPEYRAVELPVAERGAVIGPYRVRAGRAVASFFRALPDHADHPVFRLERV